MNSVQREDFKAVKKLFILLLIWLSLALLWEILSVVLSGWFPLWFHPIKNLSFGSVWIYLALALAFSGTELPGTLPFCQIGFVVYVAMMYLGVFFSVFRSKRWRRVVEIILCIEATVAILIGFNVVALVFVSVFAVLFTKIMNALYPKDEIAHP